MPHSHPVTDTDAAVEKLVERVETTIRSADEAVGEAGAEAELVAEVERLDADLATLAPGSPRLALARLHLRDFFQLEPPDEGDPAAEPDAPDGSEDFAQPVEALAGTVAELAPDHRDWTRWLRLLPDPDIFQSLAPGQLAQVASQHPDRTTASCADLLGAVLDLVSRVDGGRDAGTDFPVDAEIIGLRNRIDDELLDDFAPAADQLRFSVDYARTALDANRQLEPGQPAPPFDLPMLGGGRATLSRYAGRYLLVEFTASWCEPCHKLMPEIVALHRRWGKEVSFLGIALEDTEEDLRAYLDSYGAAWDFAFLTDRDGQEMPYVASGVPHLLLIGPDGSIVEPSLDEMEADRREAVIETALSGGVEPRAPAPPSSSPAPGAQAAAGMGRVQVATRAVHRDGDDLSIEVQVDVDAGWYVNATDSPTGIGLAVTDGSDRSAGIDFAVRQLDGPKLTGRFIIDVAVPVPGAEWELEVLTQACSGDACERPERTRLRGAVPNHHTGQG